MLTAAAVSSTRDVPWFDAAANSAAFVAEVKTMAADAPEACRPQAVANVTFTMGKKKGRKPNGTLHDVHPVWDLEILEVAEARLRHGSAAQASGPLAVRSPALSAAASVAAKQLRMALAEAALSPLEMEEILDNNFKHYFNPETDEMLPSVKGNAANFLLSLRLILSPVYRAAAEALSSSALSCNSSMVHCGVWDWYLRGFVEEANERKRPERRSAKGDYFAGIHLDGKLMLGRKSVASDRAWGVAGNKGSAGTSSKPIQQATAGPEWWNVWVLLSDGVGRTPLLLLDPASWNLKSFLSLGKGQAFIWPPRDSFEDGPPLRFMSPLHMQQGDALLFQSDTVAHGSGRLVGQDGHKLGPRAAGTRISFDARCRCKAFSGEPVTTVSGERCAVSWSLGGRIWHGCQPASHGAPEPWCAVQRSAEATGVGCILQDGSPCPHPCRRHHLCSRYYFDFCD